MHLGDYVSATTVLTTVDENADLEAYIYIPTNRATEVHPGLPVEILGSDGTVLVKSTISFISPEVDNGMQSILAKAEIPHTQQMLRDMQLVNARITWSTAPAPTVPVLAVVRVNGQPFVYVAAQRGAGFFAHQVAVTLGDTYGNLYPVRGRPAAGRSRHSLRPPVPAGRGSGAASRPARSTRSLAARSIGPRRPSPRPS